MYEEEKMFNFTNLVLKTKRPYSGSKTQGA